jgi:uncharacterized membrane protein
VTLRGITAPSLVAIVALACAVGVALGSAEWRIGLVVVVLGVGALALVGARAYLSPDASGVIETAEVTEDARLRAARYVFYVGAALMGLLTVRPAVGFTASDWVFFLAFGLTCLVLLTYGLERDYLIPSMITVGVGIFAVGGVISTSQAIAPMQSLSIVFRLLYLTIVWFWLATTLLQKPRHVEIAALAWISSAALSSAGAVVQFFYGDVIPGGTVAWGRMTGFTEHFNSLGGLAGISLAPALMFSVDGTRRIDRLIGTAASGFIAIGLLLSGSVGGLLTATIGVLFWLAVRGVTFRTVVSLVAAGLAVLLLMSATGSTNSPDPLQRIRRVTSAEEFAAGSGGTVYQRVDGYREAWEHIARQPFIGVGLDEPSSVRILGPKLVHNMLINPWFSAGILGVLGVVLLVSGAVVTGTQVVRTAPSSLRPLAAALLASVVSFVVFAMGEPILFVRYGWFPAVLLIALRAQQRRALGEQRAYATYPRRALASPGV